MSKEYKPEYRFEFMVFDKTNDTTIVEGSTFLSDIDEVGNCENVDTEVGTALRAFKNKLREKYEAENYAENYSSPTE